MEDSEDSRRIEALEDALREILDVATGFTRTMDVTEKLATIHTLADEALR